jgi:hypothetical protein
MNFISAQYTPDIREDQTELYRCQKRLFVQEIAALISCWCTYFIAVMLSSWVGMSEGQKISQVYNSTLSFAAYLHDLPTYGCISILTFLTIPAFISFVCNRVYPAKRVKHTRFIFNIYVYIFVIWCISIDIPARKHTSVPVLLIRFEKVDSYLHSMNVKVKNA